MAIKRAKTFNDAQFKRLIGHIEATSPVPIRDKLIVALSFKAGLRVGEIAKIKISAMTDVSGGIAKQINIFSDVGKKQRMRDIPMNSFVKECLVEFRKAYPTCPFVAFSTQPFRWKLARGQDIPQNAEFKQMSPEALKTYYLAMLKEFGFEGASTHSGRRTFGTELARRANSFHCSLRDVQQLMGHARMETTELYIELSEDASSLVESL